ncbi:hypothetical protein AGABI2DRAFT_179431 [Agaricus bisporus var. bisporus H97]|uniref:hypothetical protein n=1 Tax=Agaricus bisporus var. bisporus (strain H97 / ATCC MYA-4626 / FGSC 10389) TaxID=936046 RepID=UPI00029F5409|nr:hypothetical protein AGABI2DRAFT_179431 [Agaricus bisporus var. bisporus H97]EKV45998.1 hypothetical protein AGABI2DRAFT_179431 [Agaricus bisporus var. bisporus H97]
MLSKADEDQLQRVCGNDETLAEARKLVPLAKARTKRGSGHYVSGLTTALPAICAYIISKHLNNNDVALDSARQSACLNTSDFNKALRTVSTVLEAELSPRQRAVGYDILHEKYAVEMSYSIFSMFLRQTETALVQLETPYDVGSSEVHCAIFFWVSLIANVKQLPTIDEFSQDNAILSKRIAPIIMILNDNCKSLKNKIIEGATTSSRPSSPTKSLIKSTVTYTPRRTPSKPRRELLTRDSAKKASGSGLSATKADNSADTSDVEMARPETPSKKRKLDISSSISPSKRRLPFPPITPSASHITRITSPLTTKTLATPAIPSPLRRSARFVLQEEVDAVMDTDEEEDRGSEAVDRSLKIEFMLEEKYEKEEPALKRRFRPVYQDLKQWYARDAKMLRIWKEAKPI